MSRLTEQDVALIKTRQQFAKTVKTPPLDATTARTFSFVIPGIAQPGGSKQAFALYDKKRICRCGTRPGYVPLRRGNGSIIINVTADNDKRVKAWRKQVARVAHEEYAGPIFDSFLRVTFIFFQPRPQNHYTSTGKLSKHGLETPWPNVTPDTTKLVRAIEDELKGICYTDDAVIVMQRAEKHYGTPARVEITVEELMLPAQHEQVDLFGALPPPAPWETAKAVADRRPKSAGTQDQADHAAKTPDTSDDHTRRNGQNQTQAIDGPPPWESPDQVKPEQKNGKISRRK